MKHSQLIEHMLRIQRKLEAHSSEYAIAMTQSDFLGTFIYLNHPTKQSIHFNNDLTEQDIIPLALTPKYVPVPSVCLALIGMTLYLGPTYSPVECMSLHADHITVLQSGIEVAVQLSDLFVEE